MQARQQLRMDVQAVNAALRAALRHEVARRRQQCACQSAGHGATVAVERHPWCPLVLLCMNDWRFV
jgi:hypothetical protein